MSARRELIFYATPTGALAEECRAYFEWAECRPTTAQTYPPHVTLTGFFHRTDEGVGRAVNDVEGVLRRHGHPPEGSVTVEELRIDTNWVGLVVTSDWLIDVTAEKAPAADAEALDTELQAILDEATAFEAQEDEE